MTDDLTDNDIVIRQINCAHTLRRNLERLLQTRISKNSATESNPEKDNFTFDYYGDENYWMRYGAIMRLTMFVFPILYFIQTTVLRLLLFLTTPLKKLNLVI